MAAALGLLVAVGCADDSTAPRDEVSTTDAELAAIDMAGTFFEATGALGHMGAGPTGIGGLAMGPGGMIPAGGMMGGRGGGMGMPGFNVTIQVSFFDAAGVQQQRYDSLTTARIEHRESVTGSSTVQRNDQTMAMTVQRTGQMTISGLAGRETSRTLDGTASGTVTTDVTANGVQSRVVVTSSDRTTALVVPVTTDRTRAWPLSGTVSHERTMTATRAGQAAVTRTMKETITFNGTSTVQVVIVQNGQTRTCTRDLAARRMTCG